jgi:Na+-translocating ferredoxin:NAD+ oxidoreductase RnfD subunit
MRARLVDRTDPKLHVIFYLTTLVIVAIYAYGTEYVLPQVLIATFTASFLDATLHFVKKGRWLLSKGAMISGLIIGLIMTRGQVWYVPLVAAVLAIVSKHTVRWKGRNILNPAALSVAATSFIFPIGLRLHHVGYLDGGPGLYFAYSYLRLGSWDALILSHHGWVGSASAIGVVVLGSLAVYEVRRYILALSFLTAYIWLFIGFAVATNQDVIVRLSLETLASGVLFFAFFMITDPPTSTSTEGGQLVLGVAAAVTTFIFRIALSLVVPSLPCNSLLLGLLTANISAPFVDRRVARIPIHGL